MPDPLKKVSPGEKLKISAATYNAFVDAAAAIQAGKLSQYGGLGKDILRPGIVLVQNDSGANLTRYDILGLSTPIFTPDDDEENFANSPPSFIGIEPSNSHVGKFVILVEPIESGKIGRATIDGLTLARVYVTDPEHKYAEVVSGNHSLLSSGKTGSARIVWQESGSGEVWAIVRLGDSFILPIPEDDDYQYLKWANKEWDFEKPEECPDDEDTVAKTDQSNHFTAPQSGDGSTWALGSDGAVIESQTTDTTRLHFLGSLAGVNQIWVDAYGVIHFTNLGGSSVISFAAGTQGDADRAATRNELGITGTGGGSTYYAGDGLTLDNGTFNVSFGTNATEAAAGNDSRFSDSADHIASVGTNVHGLGDASTCSASAFSPTTHTHSNYAGTTLATSTTAGLGYASPSGGIKVSATGQYSLDPFTPTAETTPANDDTFLFGDSSANATKSITFANLKSAMGSASTDSWSGLSLLTATSGVQLGTSMGAIYTAGSLPVAVHSIRLCNSGGSNGTVTLNIFGTNNTSAFYYTLNLNTGESYEIVNNPQAVVPAPVIVLGTGQSIYGQAYGSASVNVRVEGIPAAGQTYSMLTTADLQVGTNYGAIIDSGTNNIEVHSITFTGITSNARTISMYANNTQNANLLSNISMPGTSTVHYSFESPLSLPAGQKIYANTTVANAVNVTAVGRKRTP